MATKVSQLEPAASVAASDYMLMNVGGQTKRATALQVLKCRGLAPGFVLVSDSEGVPTICALATEDIVRMPTWESYHFTFEDFTDVAQSQAVALFTCPARRCIDRIVIEGTVPFVGAPATGVLAYVGTEGDPYKYIFSAAPDLTQPYAMNGGAPENGTANKPISIEGPTPIFLTLTVYADELLSNLSAGAFIVHVLTSPIPST